MTLSMASHLLRPKEACSFLGISLATLYRIKVSGRLPFYKINGALRFAVSDLERYLAGCRVELYKEEYVGTKD